MNSDYLDRHAHIAADTALTRGYHTLQVARESAAETATIYIENWIVRNLRAASDYAGQVDADGVDFGVPATDGEQSLLWLDANTAHALVYMLDLGSFSELLDKLRDSLKDWESFSRKHGHGVEFPFDVEVYMRLVERSGYPRSNRTVFVLRRRKSDSDRPDIA